MTWKVEFDDSAAKELRKLNPHIQKAILSYLRQRIATDEDPRRFGKSLSKNLAGLWRYRINDYRVICNLEDEICTVLVLKIAHRKKVYI